VLIGLYLQVRALQGYLLQRTLSGPAADAATEHQAAVVRNTLMAVLSVAVKRGWLDQAMEARAALLHVGCPRSSMQCCATHATAGPCSAYTADLRSCMQQLALWLGS
jgi:hypothetical protein